MNEGICVVVLACDVAQTGSFTHEHVYDRFFFTAA